MGKDPNSEWYMVGDVGHCCSGMIRWREISRLESNPSVVCSELGMIRWGEISRLESNPIVVSLHWMCWGWIRWVHSLGQWHDRWVNRGVLRWGQMRTTHLGDGIRWSWVMRVKCVNCTRLRYTWVLITLSWGTTIPCGHTHTQVGILGYG